MTNRYTSLSIDEFAILKRHKYGVVISDPEHNQMVDILSERTKGHIINYFLSWPEHIRLGIKHVSIDMWGPYASLIPECFPNAKNTVDKYHVIANLNGALEQVRREQQKKLLHQHFKKFFFKSRFVLLKAGESLMRKILIDFKNY
jgi:transposase